MTTLHAVVLALLLATPGPLLAAPQAGQTPTVPLPVVTGPITGPGAMFPGLRAVPEGTAVEDMGYEAREYFVSGTAAGKPYTTRIVVRQPTDRARFSGTVVSEAMHASGNSWMFYFTRIYVMTAGHIHVELAAQKAPTEASIVAANPERYAALSMPDAGQVNEIIAQVGALLKSPRPDGPLAGFQVRRSVLMGTSQSAGVLRAYLALHATHRMPDGAAIFDGYLPTSTAGEMPIAPVDVPLIQIATQTEVFRGAQGGNTYRRPDGDEPGNQFRLYEMAGMPHNDSRENPTYQPDDPCANPSTTFPVGAMMAMGLHHLVQWVDREIAPPRADRIVIDGDTANDGSLMALDAHGNVRGGVRNTYVDVPTAALIVPNTGKPGLAPALRADFYCSIAGYEAPLPAPALRSLYRDAQDYQQKVEARLKVLLAQGWFHPAYTAQVLGDAATNRLVTAQP